MRRGIPSTRVEAGPRARRFEWEIRLPSRHPDAAAHRDVLRGAALRLREHWFPRAAAAGGLNSNCSRAGVVSAFAVEVEAVAPLVGADESYALEIRAGAVAVRARTTWGVLRALTTLRWLSETDGAGCALLPADFAVKDAPRFAHRGVMIDPNRNFLPLRTMKRVVDGLALLKLNVLHVDLCNANDFQFRSEAHSVLWAKGAIDLEQTYSPAELAGLVEYAAARGVLVVFEVDTPGHSASWGLGRPDVVVCDGLADQRQAVCPEPPCGYLDMRSGEALALAADVVAEVAALSRGPRAAALLGPRAPIHLGADEPKEACFGANTKPLYRNWTASLARRAAARGAPVTFWFDAFTMGAPLDPAATTLQLWVGSPREVGAALAAGYSLVYLKTDWYLDCGASNWLTGGDAWCPYASWQTVLAADPTRHVVPARAHQVKGGEVALWGEQTDASSLEAKLWTRAVAAAERLWAPRESLAGCVLPVALPLAGCWKAVQGRLRPAIETLRAAGFAVGPTQPKFCAKHPEVCDAYH